jgi:hypothetical protein
MALSNGFGPLTLADCPPDIGGLAQSHLGRWSLRGGERFVGSALAGLVRFYVGVCPGLQPGLSPYGLSARPMLLGRIMLSLPLPVRTGVRII